MLTLFLTAYGLRWFIWEYKLLANARDWLSEKHPILKELTICPYCQCIECFLFTWLIFYLLDLIELNIIEGLGLTLFFGWLGWVTSCLERYLDD